VDVKMVRPVEQAANAAGDALKPMAKAAASAHENARATLAVEDSPASHVYLLGMSPVRRVLESLASASQRERHSPGPLAAPGGSAHERRIAAGPDGRRVTSRRPADPAISSRVATAIHDYIELFHNTRRRHSGLEMLTPSEVEAGWLKSQDERLLAKTAPDLPVDGT